MAGQTYPGLPNLEEFVIATIGAGPQIGLSVRDLQSAIQHAYGRSLPDYAVEAMGDRLIREAKVCRTLGGGNFHPITHTALWCGHGVGQAIDVPDQAAAGGRR